MRLHQTQKDRSFPQEFNKLRPNSWCSTTEANMLLLGELRELFKPGKTGPPNEERAGKRTKAKASTAK